jgi:hypothetical protein
MKEIAADRTREMEAWQKQLRGLLDDSKELNQSLLAVTLGNLNPQAPPVPLPAGIPKSVTDDLINNAQRIQAAVEKTDEEWTKQAEDVRKSLQTEDEKLSEQIDILVMLYGQGKLTDEELSKGVENINKSLDKSGKVWQDFGKSIGDTTKQALLFGRSWTDALKSMAVELTQAILKMTLLKTITASAGAGGGGGFFSSLLGGLLGGKATGGPVGAGQSFIVGENGPEVLSMGNQAGYITPNVRSGGDGGVTVNNYIDARGSSITEAQFRRSLKDSEDRTVARAVATQRNLAQRR